MGKRRRNGSTGDADSRAHHAQTGKKRRDHNKKNRQGVKFQKRRKRKDRFWIEDCPESAAESHPPRITVLLTRVDLVDDHFQVKQDTIDSTAEILSLSETAHERASSDVKFPPFVSGTIETKSEALIDHIPSPTSECSKEKTNNLVKAQERPAPQLSTSQNASKIDATSSNEGTCSAKDERMQPNVGVGCKTGIEEPIICIKRCCSNAKSTFASSDSDEVYVSLPNGDCGDGIVNPFDKNQVADKYWAQRHRFFSRFDDGIQLDSESWFSVTPEQIADHIAERLLQSKQDGTAATTQSEQQQGLVVLDAFCGCGGNAIAFAKRPEIALVVCVDVDEAKLIKTGNNANIYNIPPEKLLLVHANACLVLKLYQNGFLVTESDRASEVKEASGYKLGSESILPKQIHAVFLSPPWGGTDYGRIGPREFDLKCIHLTDEKGDETNGEHLLIQATKATENKRVFYFLPRNTNGLQVAKSAVKAGFEGTIELEQNLINGKFKTLTAYFESSEGMDIIEKY